MKDKQPLSLEIPSDQTLNILVVDDEPLARRNMNRFLSEIKNINIVASCENAQQALQYIQQQKIDIVMLDIEMPGMSGLTMVRKIPEEQLPYIIFATAYDKYAVNAFEVNALDYLLKPITKERLEVSLRRYLKVIGSELSQQYRKKLLHSLEKIRPQQSGGKLTINDGEQHLVLEMSDIQYIESAGNYACVHYQDQVIIIRQTLKKLLTQLDDKMFTQIHRSILVNIEQITVIKPHINGEYVLNLLNGERLKVSRTFKQNIQGLLNK
ncbi:MAG: response regulator transcription factor [Gammaproteobacteria bacterium]|nr:response regulator transcription factor [Gammaproteobacteria bacterium]